MENGVSIGPSQECYQKRKSLHGLSHEQWYILRREHFVHLKPEVRVTATLMVAGRLLMIDLYLYHPICRSTLRQEVPLVLIRCQLSRVCVMQDAGRRTQAKLGLEF